MSSTFSLRTRTAGEIGAVALLAVIAGYLTTLVSLSWWLVGFNALLLCGFLLERRRTAGHVDVFEPAVIFVASWGLFFVARPTAMLLTNDFSLGTLDGRPGFNGALIMAAVGTIGFAAGYIGKARTVSSKRFRSINVVPDRSTLTAGATCCALTGVLLFLVFLSMGGGTSSLSTLLGGRSAAHGAFYNGVPAYVFYGVFFCFPASLMLYWQGLRDGSRALKIVAVIGAAPPIVFSFATGTRSWLLPMLLSYVMVPYLFRRQRPRTVPLVLAGFLVFFFGIVFLGTYRNADARESVGTTELLVHSVSRPSQSISSVLRSGDTEMVLLLSIIKEKVPTAFQFRYGRATGELFVHYIPRQVWKTKPRAGDELFTRQVLSTHYYGGAPRQYTPLANFYLDFGYVGVLFGMMLLGILGRFHVAVLESAREAPVNQLLYAATLPLWIPLLRGSLTDTAGRIFFVLPPALFILFLATRRAERSDHLTRHQTSYVGLRT